MTFRELLVIIPHGGLLIPEEIPLTSLSENFPEMTRNVDWFTDWLYDFRDLLGNRQIVFPYCSLVLEANRHPDHIDDCVPLSDVHGRRIYKVGLEPCQALRRSLADKYLRRFHDTIEEHIVAGAEFMLDGHSTVTARGMADDQIDIMNFQHSALDEKPVYFSPGDYGEAYAEELRRRLSDIAVTFNASEYDDVYGHIAAAHSLNARRREKTKVPTIIQETNEQLYKNHDGSLNIKALNRLRTAFAQSLAAAWNRVR